jgi:hypothetical protein
MASARLWPARWSLMPSAKSAVLGPDHDLAGSEVDQPAVLGPVWSASAVAISSRSSEVSSSIFNPDPHPVSHGPGRAAQQQDDSLLPIQQVAARADGQRFRTPFYRRRPATGCEDSADHAAMRVAPAMQSASAQLAARSSGCQDKPTGGVALADRLGTRW